MTPEEKLREYARKVDELRRLQRVTPRPPNRQQAAMLTAAEKEVDALTAVYTNEGTPAAAGLSPMV